ncbi:MAG: hemolysin family protein [Bacteroidales bacterium]|jgi:putative hemolysin|nr:hemolysin family protein [Bacteroidales bacterium]
MEALIILFFILLNGVFSMSEMAVISSRKSKLEADSKKGNNTAKQVLKVTENPDKFLSTIQIAITTIGLIIGLYTGESYVKKLADIFIKLKVEQTIAIISSRVIIILTETYVMLILGELVPKIIGRSNPERIASFIIKPMHTLSKIAYPFVWLLTKTTNILVSILGIEQNNTNKPTEDEIKSIIDDSADAGEIEVTEHDIVGRVFDLGDREIISLMTHRSELEWFDVEATIEDVINKLANNIHYIYPVADKTLDNVVGVIYIKDLFAITDRKVNVSQIMREPQFIHESVSVYKTLEIFKKNRIHYAFIIDEFGMMQGLITMNNILEALVGNSSELDTDDEEQEFIKRQDGTYLVDGQYPFYDFLSHFDKEDVYQYNKFNTLSGLILEITGRIPKEGEKIKWNDFTFEIVDMDKARIDKVLVTENEEIEIKSLEK